jgi:7-cyano-7-deazaguanine reductase
MNTNYKELLSGLSLGHKTNYESQYNPKLLQVVPRSLNRDTLDIKTNFYGYDLWHMYELSCLNKKGKPLVAIGEVIVPCDSEFIVESKSLKLYLNSFNQTKLDSLEQMQDIINKDLCNILQTQVTVKLYDLIDTPKQFNIKSNPVGINLDNLDIEVNCYSVTPELISQENGEVISETLYSNLLKSNCLITGQPDWGTIIISYTGKPLNHEQLLKYIVSLRQHNEFHEHCVERIFTDICNATQINFLEVKAFYTRRGGLDINPCRSSIEPQLENLRFIRQ